MKEYLKELKDKNVRINILTGGLDGASKIYKGQIQAYNDSCIRLIMNPSTKKESIAIINIKYISSIETL